MAIQSLIQLLYPPQCVLCDTRTDTDFALCGNCWSDMPFIEGLSCNACGCALPGDGLPEAGVLCDDCMRIARPWYMGRSALAYSGRARRLVLSLKHGDQTRLARAAGPWLARAGRDMLTSETVIIPVPLHRLRLLRRKFNQSALLAQALASETGLECCLDGLQRPKRTQSLAGQSRESRFDTLRDAIRVNPKHMSAVSGRQILLVDDVMTSGATLAACTEALMQCEADQVCVLTLARAAKDV